MAIQKFKVSDDISFCPIIISEWLEKRGNIKGEVLIINDIASMLSDSAFVEPYGSNSNYRIITLGEKQDPFYICHEQGAPVNTDQHYMNSMRDGTLHSIIDQILEGNSEVDVPAPTGSSIMSRNHCLIAKDDFDYNRLEVHDLGSRTGTYIDRIGSSEGFVRMNGGSCTPLRQGDVLGFGEYRGEFMLKVCYLDMDKV